MVDSELRIGINIGKAGKDDRGITVYTRNILHEFGGELGRDSKFVLLHYPNSILQNNLGIDGAQSYPLPLTDKHGPFPTIIGEQVLSPIQQRKLGLDVVWHPHNRAQFIVPVAYVCTMHDILPIVHPELTDQYLKSFGKKTLYASRTYPAINADAVITGSQFSKKEIIQCLGINPDKVFAIYYGIDPTVFRIKRNEIDQTRVKRTYLLPDNYALTTGSYASHKNQKTLLEAYSQSVLPNKDIGLVMVGPNDATGYHAGYEQIKEQVKALGLEGRVRLLPSVPVEDLVSIYNGATIFATASLYEGFGFTPLEAMACGVPVIASNTTAIPEVCGNAALYADPYNALSFTDQLNLLVGDEELLGKLIAEGQKQAAIFSWKNTAKRTLDILVAAARQRK